MTDSTATDGARPAGATSFYLNEIWHAAGGAAAHLEQLRFGGHGNLPSVFPVTDLAVAAVGAAGLALAEWIETSTGRRVPLAADRRLAAFWFGNSLRPAGWALPPLWDPIAGDYRAADGWIRLHTNAPHHRAAALSVLGVPLEREAVAQAVARWGATELESAIVEAHGCAAAMRSSAAWAEHPQGRAVALEPLLQRVSASPQRLREWPVDAARPLRGVRVLDLTRIIAGPVATRFLAGFGADVLRIDPPAWEEPGTVPDVVLGKRCARLDLRAAPDRAIFERLLADADVLVHGYRSDALAGLGWPAERRRELNPALLDVALDAYGWTGPWAARRGFDSLLQMSSGIAEAGMRLLGREMPTPLPVQALDHTAGYVLATAVLRGLTERWRDGCGSTARTSLARIAQLLMAGGYSEYGTVPLAPETPEDHAPQLEQTGWGPARRVLPPVTVAGAPMFWDLPANRLGSAQPGW
jgi:crotonobetainyl-CoA:carnitine CoA-transferase CaiB-like acyl-CoA transferase